MKRFELYEDGEYAGYVWAYTEEQAQHKAMLKYERIFIDIRLADDEK